MSSINTRKQSKTEREARKLLAESGLPHEFRMGRSHIKIYVGNTLAMVMSQTPRDGQDCRSIKSIINRHKAASCN